MEEPETIEWRAPGVRLLLSVPPDGPVQVTGLYADDTPGGAATHPLVELAVDGRGRVDRSAHAQHRFTEAGRQLRYRSHTAEASTLRVEQADEAGGLAVTSVVEATVPGVVRCWTEVRNDGRSPVALDFVSSLLLTGFGHIGPELRLHHARNAWCAEARWHELSLEDAGIVAVGRLERTADTSLGQFAVTTTGSWSTGDHLPMGALVRRDTGHDAGHAWLWQLEHNGPTHWAAGDHEGDLFLLCSGPAAAEHHWRRRLEPGDVFASVPVTVAVAAGGLEDAFGRLTEHRRRVRRPHPDNERLPVVFNDYMNCLNGDPTEDAVAPLVDAAAAAGAEYFVIDAGWHAGPKPWWDEVGAWEESADRFPHGLAATTDRIRAAGMVPGLWVEPEVVGVRSPAAARLPDEAFFQRDGRRLVEVYRYHLDLRHPAARAHLDATVERLVRDYGVGYLKFDYNIDAGAGTDHASDSLGDGLLGHGRALLAWLDDVLDRHPGLVIENCASGGMRADQAMLSRLSIHSTSDQTDHRRYPAIAAAAPTVVPPEQGAVWAYPQPYLSAEENALTLVNPLLGRVHLSGRIDLLDDAQRAAVVAAVDVYKAIRHRLPTARPRWPLGLPRWSDPWVALALDDDEGTLLSVWRRDLGTGAGPDRVELALPWLAGAAATAAVRYPVDLPTDLDWDDATGTLTVGLPAPNAARLIELALTPS